MTARKKAPNGAGTLERRVGNVAWVQVSLPRAPGEKLRRKRVPIAGSENMTDAQARREGAKIARDVKAGRIVFDAVPAPRPTVTGPAADWHSVRLLGAAWTGNGSDSKPAPSPMFQRFGKVNRLKDKAGAYIDKVTLEAHAYEVKTRGESGPAFGDLEVGDVTSDDVAKVMGAQPAEHRAETRIKQYNRLHRLFELAEFPCRLRPEGTNPVRKYLRPEADAEKLYCFAYPAEVLALLAGRNTEGRTVIPLARRVLYALAFFTGQRKGSLFALKWKLADFDHGTLASFKTKQKTAQYFVADRGLMAVLRAWHEHQGKPGGEEPIVPRAKSVIGCDAKRLATALREDLRAVGVTRAILFVEDETNVEPLRFHDTRSTFCTWARRQGRSDTWIGERTGHEPTGDMVSRYDRGAQTLADLEYEPFPDISRAIPELTGPRLHTPLHTASEDAAGPVRRTEPIPPAYVVGAIGFEPTTPTVSSGSSGPDESQTRVTTPPEGAGSVPVEPSRDVVCNAVCNAIDAVETALADALTKATAAGKWDMVAQFASELQARRLAREGVPTLESAKRRQRGA